MWDFVWVTLDHPRSAIVGGSLVYKFVVDWIYSFEERYYHSKFRRFALPIHIVISAAHAQN